MKKGEERRGEERGRRHTPILVLGLYQMLSKFEELKRKSHKGTGSVGQWFSCSVVQGVGERCQVHSVCVGVKYFSPF